MATVNGSCSRKSQAMATSVGTACDLELRVMAAVMASEKRRDPPWQCLAEVVRCWGDSGTTEPGFPYADLASILVSNLCFSHNTPYMWKLLEQAMATRLVYPLHVLALLTSRVNQNRREQPEAYKLYLELMRRYTISFSLLEAGPHKEKMIKSIDDALQLSDLFVVEKMDCGMAVVLFLMRTITSLLDFTLEDWGFLVEPEGQLMKDGLQSMDVEKESGMCKYRSKNRKKLRQTNAFLALEVVENMCSTKFVQVSLRLVHLNWSEQFKGLLEKLELIKAQYVSCTSLAPMDHLLHRLFCHVKKAKSSYYEFKRQYLLGHMVNTGLVHSPQSHLINSGKQCCWIPFDIFMENVMDGKTFSAAAAFEILTGLTKTLQIVNQASWQEAFQALWIAALRLLQRAKDPMAGPIPYIESRLAMLLSIVPLSVAPLLNEENNAVFSDVRGASRKQSFVACLQSLSQFASLLHPPQPVVSAANDAATKAAIAVIKFEKSSSNLIMSRHNSTKAVGNLLHLMVESCIARDLIDTSAYFWPGYVVPCEDNKDSTSTQDCPWSNFMQGASFTESLQSTLIAIPAPSVIELKKLNHLALHGSEEERSAAPKILCGASLTMGWNIQEHVVHVVVKLLSPQMSLNSPVTGDTNVYLSHLHMLAPLLSHLCRNSVISILALYGTVPEVVAALMPLCEALGSFPPPSTIQSSAKEEVSAYCVFSLAFLFLLRLCKFYGPDKEAHPYSYEGPARPDLKLDFLLLMRDSRIHNNCTTSMKHFINSIVDSFHELRCHSVHVDSFPKLRAWYFENQACLVPDISDRWTRGRMHQVADNILIFICHKIKKLHKGKRPVSGGSSSSSNSVVTSHGSSTICSPTSVSSGSVSVRSISENKLQGPPLYPAWELLEAMPLVLEAMLTACAYGGMSSRDLTTGLRDLVEFFPASIAAIIRYLAAEITRGTWKSVLMNGIDWPSPAGALNSFGSEAKEVLDHVAVHIENWHPDDAQMMLPLPLAAFLSLTITFKLDKNTEYAHAVMAQAIKHQATVSPWPITLVIGALWTQKAPKWQDYLVFWGVRSHFTNNKDAIYQLLRSCFEAFLGSASVCNNCITSASGVVGLLGESVCNSRAIGPGIFFLCTCRMFHTPCFISEVILRLVVEWACKLADKCTPGGSAQMKSGHMSLATAISAVRQVAMLGTSLLCIAGFSPLVHVLFEDTVPIFLLSESEERAKWMRPIFSILEGYAVSYLLFFSTAVMWGVGTELPPDKVRSVEISPQVIASHLAFIAKVTEGKVKLKCDPAMWKAHVTSFIGLIVRFSAGWVLGTKLDILKKISSSLKDWHEYDLALSLLALGGTCATEATLELLLQFLFL